MAAEGAGPSTKNKKSAYEFVDGKKTKQNKRSRTDDNAAAPDAVLPKQHQPLSAAPMPEADKTDGPTRKKQRHRSREEEQKQLDPQEATRRQRQQLLQEMATKLRAQGKQYVPPKKGSQPRTTKGSDGQKQDGAGRGSNGGEARKGRHFLGDKTPGWRPFSAVEVIVLPIFWNNNKEEKQAVLTASERARDILSSAGLLADMDASNKYTPGQKMKYWETMGVRVRVELGPRDVVNGNCVVALATKSPGEVASKSVVNMRHKMLDAVRSALEKAKFGKGQESDDKPKQQEKDKDKAKGKRRKGDRDQEAVACSDEEDGNLEEQGDEEAAVVAAAVVAAKSRVGGVLQRVSNPEVRKLKQQRGQIDPEKEREAGAAVAASSNAKPHSADALEDDFGDIVEFEPEEDKLILSKKERMKKALKMAKLAKRKGNQRAGSGGSEEPVYDNADEGAGGDAEEGLTEAKRVTGAGPRDRKAREVKPKVVTF